MVGLAEEIMSQEMGPVQETRRQVPASAANTHTSRISGWCDRRRGLIVSGVPLNRPSASSGGFEEPNRVHTSQQLLSRPPTAHLPFLSAA